MKRPRPKDQNGSAEKNDLLSTIRSLNLDKIINNSYDGIFVTDKNGNVLLANPAAIRILNKTSEEVVGGNVNDFVRNGLYNRSTAMEAVKARSTVTGLVKLEYGGADLSLSTSTPLLDESGEVLMVITNVRDKSVADRYIEIIEQERRKMHRYRTAVQYLGDMHSDSTLPIAESSLMKQVITSAKAIARVDSPVMLLGESGTGKEIIARYVHRNSPRAREPFIPVNCAAIPEHLLESELFGYVHGAFTGASSQGKPGLFEIADKGTLFLDEIAELPMPLQSKLLRVLERGEVQRLGATAPHRMNVRIIAATNKDLKQMVQQKLFRDDIYYRLNVVPINLPPLRRRPEDIPVLANKFLEEFNRKYGYKRTLSPASMHALSAYNWPGNVRELRNVIERLVIISTQDELALDAQFALGDMEPLATAASSSIKGIDLIPKDSDGSTFRYQGTLKSVRESIESQYIQQVLEECGGRMTEAARRLGMHRTMLYRRVARIAKR